MYLNNFFHKLVFKPIAFKKVIFLKKSLPVCLK